MAGWMEALGVEGAQQTVTALGRTWTFTLDCPLILAHAEKLCLDWGRGELKELIESLPERAVAGSVDAGLVELYHREFRDSYRAGAFRAGGSEFKRFAATLDGRLAMLVASLKPNHPEADAKLVQALFEANQIDMRALIDTLGKATTGWAQRMAPTT